jgi:hypothetical protein
MFYSYKSERKQPPCIRTNVDRQSEPAQNSRAARYPTSRLKALAIARAFRRIRGRGRRDYPSEN